MLGMTPARLLYEAAGYPECPKPTEAADGPCWVCGLPCGGIGSLVRKAVGESFTDHANVAIPSADHICVPCTWVLCGRPPNTFRLWTVVWRTDRPMIDGNPKAMKIPPAHLTAKNDLSELLAVLVDPPTDGSPWFAAVADTGQKHVLPFTKLNHSERWCIRVENENVHGTAGEFAELVAVAANMYAAGFNREEILTGAARPSKLIAAGFEFWRRHVTYLRDKHRGSLLRLAVMFLSKKGIENVREQVGRHLPPHLGGEACPCGDAERIDGEDSADGLVEARAERTAQRGGDGTELRADGVGHGAQAPDRRVPSAERQRDLFDR